VQPIAYKNSELVCEMFYYVSSGTLLYHYTAVYLYYYYYYYYLRLYLSFCRYSFIHPGSMKG